MTYQTIGWFISPPLRPDFFFGVMFMLSRFRGFTLIELLIVVAIIAILAAIAIPNFLEAQTRAKVSRAKGDMRSISLAVEAYRVDNNRYPNAADTPTAYDAEIANYLIPLGLDRGYYGFRVRNTNTGKIAGRDFGTITTPIAYITKIPTDPFTGPASTFFQYCYRTTSGPNYGYVLTSVGPDNDLLAPGGKGTTNPNVLGTWADQKVPSRLGDINEQQVCAFLQGTPSAPATAADLPQFRALLQDLTYDPTNGTISDGDLVRVGP